MPHVNLKLWSLASHTKAKHDILKRYLGAWFAILGRYTKKVIYIDGFCGPGRYDKGEKGSPIIALDLAIEHAKNLINTEFIFVFIDKKKAYIDYLKQEINQKVLPSNINIMTFHDEFANVLSGIFNDLQSRGEHLAPTFAFVDPFGFSGIPFILIQKLLINGRTEVFINIMADSINRFIEHPNDNIPQHIIDTFGTDEVIDIIKNSRDRFTALRDLYQRQLQKYAKFVRFFEMQDKNNRTIYYLFFASNNRIGHLKMKEAFWKVNSQSGFVFSDATNPMQAVLFEIDHAQELATLLKEKYKGQRVATEEIKHNFVEDETPYTCSHAIQALKLLEIQRQIIVDPIKMNGNKRIGHSFPDGVIVEFVI
ncbi:MAG: three-Cys-motif partner protein TcmP [Bellilinea sp.]